MRRLNIYLFKQCLQIVIGLIVLAMGVFILERLLRIFEIVANASGTLGAASRMLLNMLPYYLGLAIPISLFLGVMITIDRMSRSGELAASFSAGVSLFQIIRPFILIAAGLSVISLMMIGYLQPLGRYEYRAIVDRVQQTSFEAAFQEGKFAQIGRRVFWTEQRTGGDRLGQVFILEEDEPSRAIGNTSRLTVAPSGRISTGDNADETRITLNQGQGMIISPDKTLIEQLTFEQAEWNIKGDILAFRARGDDERELIFHELLAEAAGRGDGIVEPHIANATAHDQVGRSVLLLILPFIALPLGLGYGRSFSSTGIAVGVVFLLTVQKSLEMGLTLAIDGRIAPWLGTWPILGVVATLGGFLFLRSALTLSAPPLMIFSPDLNRFFIPIWGLIKNLRPRKVAG